MKKIFFLINVISTFYSFSQSADFSKVSSGIYFIDEKIITSIDPTLVNTIRTGSLLLSMYGLKQKSLAQIEGKEANYVLSTNSKFYFKFKPEEKELNSSNSNATNKIGEQNYMNLLLSKTNSKAVSPNEFKLIKLKLKKGKRSFINGKFDRLFNYQPSIDSKSVVDFKYKQVLDNLYEIYFPNQLSAGEYCFVYMASFSETNNFKVFDFSVK